MNREIKYRGLSAIDGEWVYGYYFLDQGVNRINSGDKIHPVHKKSIGQFIGIIDKNGKEIYEGDYDENYDVVYWCDKRNGWSMKAYNFTNKEIIFCHCYNCKGNFELSELKRKTIVIIGNIFSKPEILIIN